jgi:uncharacterized protein (TIGR03086 family)
MDQSTQNPTPTARPGPAGAAPDPRPLLGHALDQVQQLVAGLRPDQLDLATPCGEFPVRRLTGHLLTVFRRITALADGSDPMATPHVSEVPDTEIAASFERQRALLDTAWADDAVLDRVAVLPWLTGPCRVLASGFVQEATVHAWDLAVAIGRRADLDPALAQTVLPLARQYVPAEVRGGGVPFEAPVAVADDAGPYEQLVGWLGRDPGFAPAGAN